MSEIYIAVRRSNDPKDELKHWKYIKKERVNGQWRYYYDDVTDSKYSNNVTEENANETVAYDKNGKLDLKSKYNNVSTNQTQYKDTNRLFSKTTTDKYVEKGKTFIGEYTTKKTVITKERGALERLIARGEKWIFNKFLKNK